MRFLGSAYDLALQFRFGYVAVLHFWVLQPGSLTVYHK